MIFAGILEQSLGNQYDMYDFSVHFRANYDKNERLTHCHFVVHSRLKLDKNARLSSYNLLRILEQNLIKNARLTPFDLLCILGQVWKVHLRMYSHNFPTFVFIFSAGCFLKEQLYPSQIGAALH